VFVDGERVAPLAAAPLAVGGVSDAASSRKLLFSGAYSAEIDVEYEASCDGLHQNLVVRGLPALPAGFDRERTQIVARTLVDVEVLLAAGAWVNVAGEPVDLSRVTETAWVEVGQILFGIRDTALFWFADSLVVGADGGSALSTRRLRRDTASGAWYLEESLPVSFFARDGVFPAIWDPPLVRSGMITVDEVWPSGVTVHVQGTVTVGTGVPTGTPALLTIEPDCRVKINPGQEVVIGIGGQVAAKGQPYRAITFTKAQDEFCGELILPPPGGANPSRCLVISSGSSAKWELEHCHFNESVGDMLTVTADSAAGTVSANALRHCVFRASSSSSHALRVVAATAAPGMTLTVENNLFYNVLSGGSPLGRSASTLAAWGQPATLTSSATIPSHAGTTAFTRLRLLA
jgi:hypothetical protein